MAIQSQTIPSLIQGVTQQAAPLARDSQCLAQYDCINSPKYGAVARHGADLLALHTGEDFTVAFCYELRRGANEHYLVTLPGGGAVRVFNLSDGSECTVTFQAGYAGYLDTDGGDPSRNFLAQTVDDYTFLANKSVLPAMLANTSPARPPEALVFFKAGSYAMTYVISVAHDGDLYKFTYTTVSNADATYAQFIHTYALAGTFYKSMTGDDPNTDPNNYGTGGGAIFAPSGALVAPVVTKNGSAYGGTLVDAGFAVSINGSLLRIWRPDDNDPFTIDSSDGNGDENMRVFYENARSFAELPKGGFEGLVLRVRNGEKNDTEPRDDYWVHYVNKVASEGFWQECPKPGTKTTLNRNTMPHVLVNTGVNTFEVQRAVWSTRIAGDGIDSAKDPGFIGRPIVDMFYHEKRLAIAWEGGVRWSKSRNPYTFFPDTVQVGLADSTIESPVTAPKQVALLRSSAMVDEALFLWAQGCQFRVHSGQDPFRQDTVAIPPSTYYEFAEEAGFGLVGNTLYFANEDEEWASVRSIPFQNGKPMPDVDVTAHVSEYIPAGARQLAPSDTGQLLFVRTDGAPNWLYQYTFLVQGNQVVLSSWHPWRFPAGKILWCGTRRNFLFLALQRDDGFALLRCPLSPNARDAGPAAINKYRTRLDLRVSEAECVGSITYDVDTRRSTVTLPYSLTTEEQGLVRVVCRTTNDTYVRGREFPVVSASGAVLTVAGDLRDTEFYAGLRIESLRDELRFYVRGDKGPAPYDRLNVRDFRCQHTKTVYYRIEANLGQGRVKTEAMHNIPVGTGSDALRAPPPLQDGTVEITCDTLSENLSIRLVNDSPFPSRWTTAEYRYEGSARAKGGGG